MMKQFVDPDRVFRMGLLNVWASNARVDVVPTANMGRPFFLLSVIKFQFLGVIRKISASISCFEKSSVRIG